MGPCPYELGSPPGVCLSSYKGHQAYCMRATLLLLRSHLTLMTLQRLYLQIRSHLHRFWGLGHDHVFGGHQTLHPSYKRRDGEMD